ncbi:MAG: HDOD domain-containing protein [Pseudomonadota bacterium]
MSESDQEARSKPDLSPVSPAQANVRRLRTLAPLPATSQLLLEMLSDPELDMLRLAEVVEQTPALAARILGVANSAFFAHARDVRDVPDAIIRVLGLHLVRDLSISFALSQPFDLRDCPRFDALRYWSSAMESAVLAQLIATRLPVEDVPTPAEAYLGGLLHNLGLLALVHVAPEAMNTIFASVEREPGEGLRARETEVLGLDHAVAGTELALVWRLPTLLAVAMGPGDARPHSHRHHALLKLLRLGARIRHFLGADTDPGVEPVVLAGWSELGLASEAMPKVIAQWQQRSKEIADLAAAFLGAQR